MAGTGQHALATRGGSAYACPTVSARATTSEQEIRFCAVDGARVAVAVVGTGPPLVLPSWWVSNLEANWADARFRAFVAALARGRTVVRYDRLGTGLSDRDRPPERMTLDVELRTLEAVVDALDLPPHDLLGISYGGPLAAVYARRHPARVRRLVTFGAYARGADVAPAEVRASIVAMVRAHWGLGSRVLAEVWLPDAGTAERRELTDYQRTAATPEMAAGLLELAYAVDARDAFAALRLPTLVVHRRGDRAAPLRCGRELAALVPGARLLALDGAAHPPWHGQAEPVVAAALAFLDEQSAAPPVAAPAASAAARGGTASAAREAADAPLTPREREVLRLVAAGLGDAQIAQALHLSPHTVHRHVANIRAKLRQPTRAAAAAEGARLGLL